MPDSGPRLAHRTPGRARLHAPAIRDRPAEAARLAQAVAAIPGVSSVQARAATGSLIVFHTGEWDAVAAALAEALGGEIGETPPPTAGQALETISHALESLDAAAVRTFGGRTDLSELAFLGLVGAGAVQLARGQVFGPAVTLLGQALALAAARRSRGSA